MSKKYLILGSVTGMLMLVVSAPALAQAATEIAPINNLLDSILGVLTGRAARTGAAIALAVVGWAAYSGRMDKRAVIGVIIAIILVFGAPTIVEWLDTVA